MVLAELKSLSEIWARRQSDRVGVMNLLEKEAYLVLNAERGSFETFSSKHGILNLSGQDADAPQWIEWSIVRQLGAPSETESSQDAEKLTAAGLPQ